MMSKLLLRWRRLQKMDELQKALGKMKGCGVKTREMMNRQQPQCSNYPIQRVQLQPKRIFLWRRGLIQGEVCAWRQQKVVSVDAAAALNSPVSDGGIRK
jgi:hypothetical protein